MEQRRFHGDTRWARTSLKETVAALCEANITP